MKNCQCPNCGTLTEVSTDTVKRRWLARGYKFEGWVYSVECPTCKMENEIKYPKLPIKVRCHFWFKR